jgi:hypothetical protein
MNVPLWVKNVRCANRTSDSVEGLTHGDERKEPGRQHSFRGGGGRCPKRPRGTSRRKQCGRRARLLQIVNQIAPDNRRAEVVSSYLMFCYAGVSLPVIGIGVLSAIIAAIALIAIAVDIHQSSRVIHKKL